MKDEAGTHRGDKVNLGPFEFRVPDRECQIVDCEENADGVIELNSDETLSCCIDHAPQFLDREQSEWTPLAGGRSLESGGCS